MTTSAQGQPAPRSNPAVLVAVLAASVLASLDLFIVNLAVPRIGESFPSTSPQALSWVLNGYTVAFAALLAPAGRMADRFGRRRAFGAGLLLFTIASLLACAAPAVGWLTAARALQGVGASLIVPTSLALMLESYSENEHRKMVSIWAATGSVAAAIGPAIGGVLSDIDWRLVFAINVPIGLVALLAARSVPASRTGAGPAPDWVGALALATTVGSLVTLLSFWADWTPADARFWAAVALCAAGGTVFLRRSATHPAPVVDLTVFRVPAFASAAVGMAAFYTGFSMMLLACSLWATNVWGWDSVVTGLCFVLGPGTAVATALAGGRLKIQAAWLSAASGALFIASGVLWALTLTHPEASPLGFLTGMVLTGAAAGIAQTGFLSAGTSALSPTNYATGTGVLNTARQIGAALGVALLVLYVGTGNNAAAYHPAWLTIAATGAIATATSLHVVRRTRHPQTEPHPAPETRH